MEVATWFLILVLATTRAYKESDEDLSVILSRWQIWVLIFSLLCLFEEKKEKQLGKMSIRWDPGTNSLLKELKEENFLLNLLSMSTIGPLINKHWFKVRVSNDNWWDVLVSDSLDSRRDLKMWL